MSDIPKKTVIKNFEYRLYLGPHIEGSAVTEIPPLHAKQNVFFTKEKKDYSIVLSGLKFTRKLYEPGLIEAEVTIKPALSFSDAETLFEKRQVELTVVDTDKTKADNNEATIAKNYFVYKINPQIVTNNSATEMYVKLTIHSFDKLMAVDKYCQAFTAKKLASEILKNEFPGFGLTSNMVQTDIKNLLHLKYTDTNKQDAEIIQPYLVQYNESFYDFLVRTANRCGEFLYFEDGKLTIGLPNNTKEALDSFNSVTLQGYTSGPIDVDYFSRDSMKDNGSISKLNADPVTSDDAGYPKDSFLQKQQYNNPVAGGEYIFPLEDDKYTSLNRELALREDEADKTMPLKIFSQLVGITDGDPINAILQMGTKMAADATNAGIMLSNTEKDIKDKLSDSFSGNKEHYSSSKLVEFSSLDSNGWISNEFYSKIRKDEETQQKKIICIDMGTSYAPVKLGDKIQVGDLKGTYIVIQVNLIANMAWVRDFRIIDPDDPTTDLYSNRQSQIIWAIPIHHPKKNAGTPQETDDETVELIDPPVASVPAIRKTGPQTAFVVDNDDKKYQGRVRIVYPWQSSNDDKRLKMYAVSDSLSQAQEDFYKAEAEYLALKQAKLLLDKLIEEDLAKLEGMSEEEREKYYQQLQDDIDADKASMAELDKSLPDPILNDPDEDTEISKDKYLENEKARKENREAYDKLKADAEKKELLLKYLEKAGYDIQATKTNILGDGQDLISKQANLSAEISNKKTNINNLKEDLKTKAADWNKSLAGMATPWVRVAMPMATGTGGAFFTLNKGDEVLVNFDSDNIERPYIVGSVYSKNHVAPGWDQDRFAKNFLQKKSSMTLMSPNGQHISFCAPNDGWKFAQAFLPSMKTLQGLCPDLKKKTDENGKKKTLLAGQDARDLNGGIYMGDRYGMYELSLSSHDRKIKINSPFGNVEIGAFTGITVNAPNGDIKISGKNVTIEAGNKLTLNSGTNVKKKRSWGEWGLDLLTGIGSTYMENTFLNILKPVDLAMVRSVIEIFLRPIDGTLMLKSNNYVMLESGKGKVQVPLDRYSRTYQQKYKMANQDAQKVYGKIVAYIKLLNATVDNFQKDYLNLKEVAFEKRQAFVDSLRECWLPDALPDVVTPSFGVADNANFANNNAQFQNGTLQGAMADIKREKIVMADGFFRSNGNTYNTVDALKTYLQPIAEDYGRAIVALHHKVLKWEHVFDGDQNYVKKANQEVLHADTDDDTTWIDNHFRDAVVTGDNSLITKAINTWKARYGDAAHTDQFMATADKESPDDPFFDVLLMKRKAIAIFLKKLRDDAHNTANPAAPAALPHNKYFDICYTDANLADDNFLKDKWHYVAHLKDKGPWFAPSTLDVLGVITKFLGLEKLKKYYLDNNPLLSLQRTVWNDKSGQILFSSEEGATYSFKGTNIEKLDQISSNNKDTVRQIVKSIK